MIAANLGNMYSLMGKRLVLACLVLASYALRAAFTIGDLVMMSWMGVWIEVV